MADRSPATQPSPPPAGASPTSKRHRASRVAPHVIRARDSDAVATASLPLPEQVALVLQGGGALGSFQAGVFGALSRYAIAINWVAGISIGAINAALIVGNPVGKRRPALQEFWRRMSSGLPAFAPPANRDWREAMHVMAAGAVAAWGVPGFFLPRMVPPAWSSPGSAGATSFYDTTPLIATLNDLVDWRLINEGPVRLSVGAVDVESGNFTYFDNHEGEWAGRIDARHILASGALPPGFPAVEIEGRHYWDGGLVSNTPLQHVIDHQRGDMLVFQVDLFPAEGKLPRRISDVTSREKDIQFSSRTRAVTDQYLRERQRNALICALMGKLPADVYDLPEAAALRASLDNGAVNIVQLIYRNRDWQTGARDYEFSPASIRHHMEQGEAAVASVLLHGDVLARNIVNGETAAFDLGEPMHD